MPVFGCGRVVFFFVLLLGVNSSARLQSNWNNIDEPPGARRWRACRFVYGNKCIAIRAR